jgi:hypothetical protein
MGEWPAADVMLESAGVNSLGEPAEWSGDERRWHGPERTTEREPVRSGSPASFGSGEKLGTEGPVRRTLVARG